MDKEIIKKESNLIEQDNNKLTFTSYRKDIAKMTRNNTSKSNQILDYSDAEKNVVDYISKKRQEEIDRNEDSLTKKRLSKKDLKEQKRICRKYVSDCMLSQGFKVRGYEGDKTNDFINEMVNEYAGYSILDDAFNDPDVDDIFCLSWNKIYVERNGKNVLYEKIFKSEKHYTDVVNRFIGLANKELNVGDSKIVDFELYGDRGCATSKSVSPKDISLTIRKHREDHIILEDLLAGQVLNQEISDFFGTIIDGESNIIYAGITGTGKTTTIRALLDYYVTKNKKRMLVCEDTQELFPKNDHTLELISSESDDEKANVPLYKLIITALRLKPKYIVVGEVRGAEAQAAVEGMETGHSTIFTMHAGEPINAINRLVSKYLMMMPSLGTDVVERIIGSAVDFIAIQDHIPGQLGRKVSIISEVDYNNETKRIVLRPLMKFNLKKQDWEWVGRISPNKIRNLMRRGVDVERANRWGQSESVADEDRGKTEEEIEQSEATKKLRRSEDIKALNELNDTYLREKEERLKIYKKEKEIRDTNKIIERLSKRKTEDKHSFGLKEEEELTKSLEKIKELKENFSNLEKKDE